MWLHREWKDNVAMAGPASSTEVPPAVSPSPKGKAKNKAKAQAKADSVERQPSPRKPKPKGGLAVYVPPSSIEDGGCQGSAPQSGEKGLSHDATEAGNEDDVDCEILSGQYGHTSALVSTGSSGKGLSQGLVSIGTQRPVTGAFPSQNSTHGHHVRSETLPLADL